MGSDVDKDSDYWGMKIIRFKNLFRVSPMGMVVPSDLPTGYRHILVNLRLDDGMVVGEFIGFGLGQIVLVFVIVQHIIVQLLGNKLI